MSRFALFKDGRQISKAYSTKRAVVVEALELGSIIRAHPDFPGDPSYYCLAEGYEIRELGHE